ncbi:MAG: hypothetical protein E7620_09255 [Ruminococcaceae bacterium]|nr:hypothetical protein [Oscillospiraceae bacterium]
MKQGREIIAELNREVAGRRASVNAAAIAFSKAVEALGLGLAEERSIFGGRGVTAEEFSDFCKSLETVERCQRGLQESIWRFFMLDSEFLRAINGEADARETEAVIVQRISYQRLCERYVNRLETMSKAFLKALVDASDMENKGARCKKGEVKRLCNELKIEFDRLVRSAEA